MRASIMGERKNRGLSGENHGGKIAVWQGENKARRRDCLPQRAGMWGDVEQLQLQDCKEDDLQMGGTHYQ
jgi:hypothetical protein